MIRIAREAIVAVSRQGFVRNVGFLGAGAGAVPGWLPRATPFILSLYGASAFGLFATILATTSVIGGLVAMHIDTAIPVIEARFRALRLVAAVVGIIGAVTVVAYAALALLSVCSGGLRN